MKKKLFVLCTICFMFLFSGCELFDVLEDAINKYWGAPSRVDVLVLPPYPLFDDKDETAWNRALSGVYSEDVKNALMRGIEAFNDGSRRTRVVPRYVSQKQKDLLDNFYNELSNNMHADTKVRKCLKEMLDIFNKLKDDETRENYKCVICGIYKYNRSAQVNTMMLLYFDKEKDCLVGQNGVVTKEEGFDQDNDLERLMTALLKKTYGGK